MESSPPDEWNIIRSDEEFKLDDVSVIIQELDSVRQSHNQVRTNVLSIRNRLELIHQRRLIRDSNNNTTGQKSTSSIAQQQQQ
jgi:hypothetical protein